MEFVQIIETQLNPTQSMNTIKLLLCPPVLEDYGVGSDHELLYQRFNYSILDGNFNFNKLTFDLYDRKIGIIKLSGNLWKSQDETKTFICLNFNFKKEIKFYLILLIIPFLFIYNILTDMSDVNFIWFSCKNILLMFSELLIILGIHLYVYVNSKTITLNIENILTKRELILRRNNMWP